MGFANHYILFKFTFYTMSQHFWNWVYVSTAAKVYLAHYFLIICFFLYCPVYYFERSRAQPVPAPPSSCIPPADCCGLTQLPLQSDAQC